MTITVGSLCSGIGGIDLGLERAGMTVRWQSEIDPYACRVLAKHWPDVPNLGDIKQIEWSTVERVDLICAGYPCQPFSLAGSRQGEADPRHLWPFVLNAIRALRPRWVLLENVAGHRSLGFGTVLGDLATSGYDAEWDCIPAVAVGAPHRRDRVFVVAHAVSDELWHEPVGIGGGKGEARWFGNRDAQANAHSDVVGQQEGCQPGQPKRQPHISDWWAAEPPVEWLMGFPPSWTDCESWGTPSSRRSPSTSGASSLKPRR